MRRPLLLLPLLPLLLLTLASGALAQKRPLEFEDLLRFRQIQGPVLSQDGNWVAYGLVPDRGDGEGVLRATRGGRELRVERGCRPRLTPDGRWAAFRQEPPFAEQESAKEGEEPRAGLVLVDGRSGERRVFEEVQDFGFSEDGRWLVVHHLVPRSEKEEDEEEEKEERAAGGRLWLIELEAGVETPVEDVREWALDETGRWLACARATATGEGNALVVVDLAAEELTSRVLGEREKGLFGSLRWAFELPLLAWLEADASDEKKPTGATLHAFDGEQAVQLASADQLPDGWELAPLAEPTWSRDGGRLFFGLRKVAPDSTEPEEKAPGEDEEPALDPWDLDALLKKSTLQVWHWQDPHIQSHQRASWEEERKRSYLAVVHRDDGAVVPLANEELPTVLPSENPQLTLGRSDRPYRIEKTFDGWYHDLRLVDLRTGAQREVARRIEDPGSLSPRGGYVAWYEDGDWHLLDTTTGQGRNLTEGLGVSFADELHDLPEPAPGYGLAGWVEEDAAVLLYDRFDLWRFPTDGGPALRLTDGRPRSLVFRVLTLDPKALAFASDGRLLLSGYDDRRKSSSFHEGRVGAAGTRELRAGEKRYRFLAKAEEADRLLYTEERYDEFADLWTADLQLKGARKISEANPQMAEFAWGHAELVDFASADGRPLQGVLIRPEGLAKGERAPVLVYFYRFMSQRLHEFNEPVVNHRPSFPVYVSHGYAVWLPDVRFEIGRPGLSAVKCLLPGVQKLVDMGLADPERVGLHGHSWSGYQTAFVITQTDRFAAAVAGAPVSNMTSAYGGIRAETGVSRQFQYEQSQSRLGASLWESPQLYWENSPLFFADRIRTPLLIEFGTEDGAVPFGQGVELYMAMRRLDHPCVMLAYGGEGHHLKKPANKLDYSIRMKEWFDHFLKGAPAPSWWTEGVPYRGD